jgi:hypothetical protein
LVEERRWVKVGALMGAVTFAALVGLAAVGFEAALAFLVVGALFVVWIAYGSLTRGS